MNKDVMFSSKRDDWETPQDFFNRLNNEFHFTLDPCADEFNHKCDKWFSKHDNGLEQSWGGGNCFLQSTIRAEYREVGQESKRRDTRRCNNGCYANSRTHGHSLFP